MVSILVVDDEPDIRFMVRTRLRRRGWTVTEAASGQQALDIVRGGAPAAIVMDHKMPGLTGIETARRLRSEGVGVPIVIFSAYLTPDLEMEADRMGLQTLSKADVAGLETILVAWGLKPDHDGAGPA